MEFDEIREMSRREIRAGLDETFTDLLLAARHQADLRSDELEERISELECRLNQFERRYQRAYAARLQREAERILSESEGGAHD